MAPLDLSWRLVCRAMASVQRVIGTLKLSWFPSACKREDRDGIQFAPVLRAADAVE